MIIRTYSELSNFATFEERYQYLKLSGIVGEETFGFDRILNQTFYKSLEWKRIRDFVILRDNGCDLGIDGRLIGGKIIIHHLNPLTKKDIREATDYLLNPEFLICTSLTTHNAIHYGNENLLIKDIRERSRNDTCPWKKG